ncbi:MAG TPA: class I SAM-dependent methyltransferase [Acidimicrobiales bacterium]
MQSHQRRMAESSAADPERYDRTRPRYPDELVQAVIAHSPGRVVLDVGCGTGVVARQFQAAGCQVLGVDVDERMADYARRTGVAVEVSSFEQWDPDGRRCDAVVAGQTWHWVDPIAGAAKAAEVLRPGGRLAVFWNVFLPPPHVARALTEAHASAVPTSPFAAGATSGFDGYILLSTMATDGIRQVGAFTDPVEWRFDWQRDYTRDEWLEQLRNSGEAGRLTPEELEKLLAATGAALDGLGGTVTMPYATMTVTATRHP